MDKRAVLVARDVAPSDCFNLLGPVLKERGFGVDLIIGNGKPLAKTMEEIALAASRANVVVLGMSSSAELARPEIVAGKAARNAGVPYGFYGDMLRCWARARPGAWFEELASSAAFYLGVTHRDADGAREVFPNAKLFCTGNPLREEMAFPRFTREEVRAKLGVVPGDRLVIAPCGKFAAGNMALWTVLMEAISFLVDANGFVMKKDGPRLQLVLATHPGDRTPYAVDAETKKEMKLYEELVSLSPVPARIVGKDVFPIHDLVAGADIIVQFDSSAWVAGAYRGVPVVSLGLEVLFRRYEKAVGSRALEAVEDGLSEFVQADVHKLAEAIQRLLTTAGSITMRARQHELYPRPTERGLALRKIADALAQV